ncbi:YiiX/YebB-like N1pC/P60 family cysteine hydrolase [Thiolapillus brandeum]|uniref:Uncharacterized protein n=1 Tax=Thiolapillus brandeum TaxID=1076588 RepID=A0A7U6GL57_9GAMM|nr:YiiX/YebB-like N1pC/P60 family cysteine hydrolase [Thiolapillus brandeum]BAO45635.1 hypothetical protein TBH_C2733 [Thiolapillus brandeum]
MAASFTRLAKTLEGLRRAVLELEEVADLGEDIRHAIRRGYFTPDEDERLWRWFAGFLEVRDGLWQLIHRASAELEDDLSSVQTRQEWRWFILGFTAAALLVRLDRLLVEGLAVHPLTQRKLNEASPVHGIGRKQYTGVFQSLTNPDNALLARNALNCYRANRARLRRMGNDPRVGVFIRELPILAQAIDPGVLRYLSSRLRYRLHSLRRRGASMKQQSVFRILQTGGRLVAEASLATAPRVREVQQALENLLQPGDVIITRHDHAASNLFLPGFWPHAALYIGSPREREALGVALSGEVRQRWHDDIRVLEADKEGVLFRRLEDTLAVDAVVVLRPQCDAQDIARAIARACRHEGKGYNFDFDFFRGDRLVCTEVVYRAYDGLGPMRLHLSEHAGRPALSAEDLLDLALEGRMFKPVALFGVAGCKDHLMQASRQLEQTLLNSYRSP